MKRRRCRPILPCLLACSCLPLAGLVSAQDFAATLPAAPTGFVGGFGGPVDSLMDGFSGSVSLSGVYDSNLRQGGGGAGANTDDFTLSLGGNVGYRTQGRDWVGGGSYRASYSEYFDNSSFSGFNHGAGLFAGFQGPKLNAMYNLGIGFDRGANRYYGDFVERTSITQSLSASYRISPKTSLAANMGYSFSSADGAAYGDTQSFSAGLSALWRYSPLLQVGPGIRYGLATGQRQPDRHSFGPSLNANYTLTTKISLTSTVGLGFVEYSGRPSSDTSMFASLGANYRASDLWGMNLSLHRDAQADPAVAGGFNEITAIQIGYNRRIRRASFGLSLGYEHNSFENPGGAVANRGDSDYWSISTSLGMPLFANTVSSSVFASYREETSGRAGSSWDGYQIGFSLARGF
jgi:hypothetical protein